MCLAAAPYFETIPAEEAFLKFGLTVDQVLRLHPITSVPGEYRFGRRETVVVTERRHFVSARAVQKMSLDVRGMKTMAMALSHVPGHQNPFLSLSQVLRDEMEARLDIPPV